MNLNFMRIIGVFLFVLLAASSLHAQNAEIIDNESGRITFAVDKVEIPDYVAGWVKPAGQIAAELNYDWDAAFYDAAHQIDWKSEILACSFEDDDKLFDIGSDVIFQMLLQAWCQHRPVVLSPDAVWMVIEQGFSLYVNNHPEEMRNHFVGHEGKKELALVSLSPPSSLSDWENLVKGFVDEIDRNTLTPFSSSLVADFSTTGIEEQIASKAILMDVAKQYFDYKDVLIVCGIPSITLTGTPEDWRKVLEKTKLLDDYGLDWWVRELEPVLNEFIAASERNPRLRFWRDIVRKRPLRKIHFPRPTCARTKQKISDFDGWFLKFFPFDTKGRRTPEKVSIKYQMPPETVCVPFTIEYVDNLGNMVETRKLEFVAGIVAVNQDIESMTLTPKIGWLVRTARE